MDNFIYINACKTTLSAGITAEQTVISISNPSRFPESIPAGHYLVLTLHPSGLPSTQEIVHCTEVSGADLTVVRGAQGTAPASWPAGTVVGAYLTAEMLTQIANDVNGHAGSGGAAHAAATTLTAGFMAAADKVKLNGVEVGATKYQHPANHAPDIIAQNSSNRFASDLEKGNWNAAKNHADSAHAPSNAQKNSDILKSEIEAKLTGGISSHSHPAYLPLAGGTMAGDLTIQNTNPSVHFIDTDHPDRHLHCNSGLIGFLNSGGGWSFYSKDDGVNVSAKDMIIGSSTHSTDGNIYMPWAGRWLSDVIGDALQADMGHNAVGSLCFAVHTTSAVIAPGSTIAGSNLRASSTRNNHGSSLSGTWRCLGSGDYDDGARFATLYQRIA